MCVGLEQILLPLSVEIFPSTLCPRWGECWSKWGLRAHWCLMCCLWTCLWLRSNIAPNSVSFPFPCYDHARSSARLWHRVGRVEVFAQVRVWLLELEDCSADSRGLGCLCGAIRVTTSSGPPCPTKTTPHTLTLSALPDLVFSRIWLSQIPHCAVSWNEWGRGVCLAWVGKFGWTTASNAKLSVLSVGKPALVLFPCLLSSMSVHPMHSSFCFRFPPKRTGPKLLLFSPILPWYMAVFLATLVVWKFCQFPVSFPGESFHMFINEILYLYIDLMSLWVSSFIFVEHWSNFFSSHVFVLWFLSFKNWFAGFIYWLFLYVKYSSCKLFLSFVCSKHICQYWRLNLTLSLVEQKF